MKVVCSVEGSFAIFRLQGFIRERMDMYRSAVEGSRYDRERRASLAPLDRVPHILRRLRENGFPVLVEENLSTRMKETTAQQWVDLRATRERVEIFDRELPEDRHLFPYQKFGAQWLSFRTAALLADPTGTGKTAQCIAALPAKSRILVVGPAIGKSVWPREVDKFRPMIPVRILSGRNSLRWPEPNEMLVTNYDILPSVHEKGCNGLLQAKPCPGCLKEMNDAGMMLTLRGQHSSSCGGLLKQEHCPGCATWLKNCPAGVVLVGDEAHMVKNFKSQRGERFSLLAETVRKAGGRSWLITATPMLNRPQEMWSIFRAAGIAEEAFGSWKNFVQLFKGRQQYFGGYTWGTPEAEVGERIRRVCLRRRKEDVLPDLPPKRWEVVRVDVDRETLKKCDEFVKERGGIDRLVRLLEKGEIKFETMSMVRAALATAKIPAMVQLVDAAEEEEEPIVVFSAHRPPIDLLAPRKGWRVITGDIGNPAVRKQIEDDFQAGNLRGLGCTIQAGGVAITLTRAMRSIFVDLDYSPELNAQAEDRLHRIGQTRGTLYTRIVANHILDQRISEILGEKTLLISKTLEMAATEVKDEVGDADLEAMLRDAEEVISGETGGAS